MQILGIVIATGFHLIWKDEKYIKFVKLEGFISFNHWIHFQISLKGKVN